MPQTFQQKVNAMVDGFIYPRGAGHIFFAMFIQECAKALATANIGDTPSEVEAYRAALSKECGESFTRKLRCVALLENKHYGAAKALNYISKQPEIFLATDPRLVSEIVDKLGRDFSLQTIGPEDIHLEGLLAASERIYITAVAVVTAERHDQEKAQPFIEAFLQGLRRISPSSPIRLDLEIIAERLKEKNSLRLFELVQGAASPERPSDSPVGIVKVPGPGLGNEE